MQIVAANTLETLNRALSRIITNPSPLSEAINSPINASSAAKLELMY